MHSRAAWWPPWRSARRAATSLQQRALDSLALAHLDVDEKDNIVYSPWTETDFRTGLEPWWK